MFNCKICRSKTLKIINFGKMPIANGFVKKPHNGEFVFTLRVVFCPKCLMVQLAQTVPPKAMFHDHYQFFSSTSKGMEEHFKKQAEYIIRKVRRKKDPFVIEIGSNDGIMLKHIAKAKIRHLGVEPSTNVARQSKKLGVNVTTDFFNKNTAWVIEKKYSKADLICGSNVICHIENINSVFEGVRTILKNDGVFFFQEPYLYDIIRLTSFDQIYDEHVYYYSGLSVSNLAQKHNLELVDMKHQNVHGGSMRYYLKPAGKNTISTSVKKWIAKEKRLALNKFEGYNRFKKKVDRISLDLKNILLKLSQKNYRVAGYAATSKSTTILNYAKIGPDLVEYISDTTPTKIGLFTPGTHIPVKSHDYFSRDFPTYTLLFAYNHKKEIFEKEKSYRKKGGKFIIYFPRVTIV